MRRLVVAAVLAVALSGAAAAHATTNPITYRGSPLSLPDPSISNYGSKLVAIGTSDFGQWTGGPFAFPMYVSDGDMGSWRFINYILKPGSYAPETIPATGHYPGGEYWAPSKIRRVGNRWVLYYAAQLKNPARQMALFVAWTDHIFSGPWHSKLLHKLGDRNQFNPAADREHPPPPSLLGYGEGGALDREAGGGVIDPSASRGYIVWCKQPNEVWISTLSPDGLTMGRTIHRLFRNDQPWEKTVTEGPVITWAGGYPHVLYNGASTWDDSYATGEATPSQSTNLASPTVTWTKRSPILRSGPYLKSPGIGDEPFVFRNRWWMAFHVQLGHATHNMLGRWLAFASASVNSSGITIPGGVPPRSF